MNKNSSWSGPEHDSIRQRRLRSRRRLICGLAWMIGTGPLAAASGDLDTTYGSGGLAQIDVVPSSVPGAGYGTGSCVAVQADRKILVAGAAYNRSEQGFGVVRYSAGGVLDSTFGGDGKVVTTFGTTVFGSASGIAVQADNKIVVSGTANGDFTVVRYLANGTLDTSFSSDGKASLSVSSASETPTAMAIQPDGGIVVAGYVTSGGTDQMVVARFRGDGGIDTSFGAGGFTILELAGSNRATCVALQPDGRILLGGGTSVGYDMALVRLNADGTMDGTFGNAGLTTVSFGSYVDFAYAVALQADGRILLGGYTSATSLSPQSQSFAVARIQPDGTLDPTFGSGGLATAKTGSAAESVRALAVRADSSIVAVGTCYYDYPSPTGNRVIGVARFGAGGTTLETFWLGSYGLTKEATGMAPMGDGSFAVAGYHFNGSKNEFLACRLGTSGFDLSFGTNGCAYTQMSGGEDTVAGAALGADGKIYLAGTTWAGLAASVRSKGSDFAMVRLLGDGRPDTTFSGDGLQTTSIAATDSTDTGGAMALQSDGKVLVVGSAYDGTTTYRTMVRYLANGNLDTTFGTGGKFVMAGLAPTAVAVQPNGRILVVGPSYVVKNSMSTQRVVLTRHLANGTLDGSFASGGSLTVFVSSSGSANDIPYALALQQDGRILVAGVAGGQQAFVVRVLAGGTLDPSFDGDGIVTSAWGGTYSLARAVAVQADDRIVLGGAIVTNNQKDFALVRYLSDGTPDPSFGIGGTAIAALTPADDQVNALSIQNDGRIVAAGYATPNGLSHFAVARYWGDGRPDTSFHPNGCVIQPVGIGRSEATAVAVQPNGAIVAAGTALREYDYDFAVARFEGGPEIAVETTAGVPVPAGATSSLGVVTIGNSGSASFLIKNLGSSVLHLSEASLVPPASGFSINASPAHVIAPAGSTTLSVTFSPTNSGEASSTIRLLSDDADEAIYELHLSATANQAPVWTMYGIATPWQTPVSLSLRKLLVHASDADGDSLTVSAVGPTSAKGGTVALLSSSVSYTPPAGFSGNDTFSITIMDSRGASVIGTVTVTVGAAAGGSGSGGLPVNPPRLRPLGDGTMEVAFQGIPGRSYKIQRSTDLATWTAVAVVTASNSGSMTWTDPAPPQPTAYYRLAWP